MSTSKLIAIAAILILIAAGLCWIQATFLVRTIPGTNASIAEQETYWHDRIATLGGDGAYGEFARAIAPLTIDKQHMEAHIFGGALYKAEGIKGVTVCDERFSQGCFHEFMGETMSNLGIGVLSQLVDACSQEIAPRSYFCTHGIGHGLIALFGYNEPALNKALAECDKMESKDPVNGCYTGVFMEYNLHIVQNGGGTSPNTLTDANKLEPCQKLTGTSQWICYYTRFPLWWYQVLKNQGLTGIDLLKKGRSMCDEITTKDFRELCYKGIGHYLPVLSDFTPQNILSLCEETFPEDTYQLFCRAEAANFLLTENLPDKALAVCAGYTGSSKQYCTAYATHADEKNILIPEPL